MRIGFDAKKAQKNLTGIGNYSRRVVNALFKYEEEDELMLYGPKKSHPDAESQIPDVERHKKGGPLYEWWRCRGVAGRLKKDHIDLYHGLSNEIPFGIRRRSAKSVVTIHDLIFKIYPETYSRTARWILNLKTRYACRATDHIVAVSECTKNDIVRLYGVRPEKISVVYQSIGDRYRHTPATSERPGYRYVICVGTIETRKNQLTLVKALKEMPQELHLVLVGKSTPYQRLVEQEAAASGTTDRLHILNHIDDNRLWELYSHAEALLYMSRYEGFGIPVAEAIAMGVPVVAARGSCLEEAGGPDSIYLDPDDYHGVARAVADILGKSGLRESMIERGRLYSQRFSDQNMAHGLQEVYRKVLRRKTLVIRLSALGDVAMTIPAVKEYARRHPEKEVLLLTQTFFAQLLQDGPSNLKALEVSRQDYKGMRGTFRLIRILKAADPDEAADLHNVMRSWVIDLWMRMHGKRVVIVPKKRKERRMILSRALHAQPFTERYVETLSRLDPADSGDGPDKSCSEATAEPPRKNAPSRPTSEKLKIGIAPFARYADKTYPMERMREVIDILESDPRCGEIHLFGARGAEQQQLDEIASGRLKTTSHAGRHSLTEELELMREMDVMLTMDSANMHLASLVGTRVVSIWGSTTPACGFLGWGQKVSDAIVAGIPCQPCTIAGSPRCRKGTLECMMKIEPREIVTRLLNQY